MAPKKSVVNCQASEYHRNDCLEIMCALSATNAAELKLNDFKSITNSDSKPIREIQKFPCHTQAAER